jgi:hypothetical protein
MAAAYGLKQVKGAECISDKLWIGLALGVYVQPTDAQIGKLLRSSDPLVRRETVRHYAADADFIEKSLTNPSPKGYALRLDVVLCQKLTAEQAAKVLDEALMRGNVAMLWALLENRMAPLDVEQLYSVISNMEERMSFGQGAPSRYEGIRKAALWRLGDAYAKEADPTGSD